MSSAPDPLTPADCDLRGYDFMPLYGTHLFGSEFNARASDEAWRAALTLWWAAWNQRPAASLPSDDVALCRLADLGRDLRRWDKIKADALHGFVLCSDGRLYHRFLAPLAIEAWQRRCRERDRKASWRQRKDADATRTETRTETGTERGRDVDVPAERRGEDRRGQVGGCTAPTPPPPTSRDILRKELRKRGLATNPEAVEEWADFLTGSCGLRRNAEVSVALTIINAAAVRDGVTIAYAKHAAPFAREVAERLREGRRRDASP